MSFWAFVLLILIFLLLKNAVSVGEFKCLSFSVNDRHMPQCGFGSRILLVFLPYYRKLITSLAHSVKNLTYNSNKHLKYYKELWAKLSTHICHITESKRSLPSIHSSSPRGSDTAEHKHIGHLILKLDVPHKDKSTGLSKISINFIKD